MRFEFTVHVDGDEQDVLVSTPRPLRLGEVWPQLLAALGLSRRLTPELPLTAVLGERRFTTGSVLRSVAEDAEGAPAADVATGPCVQVIGGHDAGACAPLRSGPVRIGRDAHCELRLHDERVSRRHATIRGDANGAVVHDDVSTNGTTVEGAVVGRGEVPLPVGAVARVGDTVLTVREHDEPALPLVHAGGRLDVTPRPRPADPEPAVLDIAGRPPRPHVTRTQWLAALIPALAGCALAWFTHSPTFLLFALLSPVMVLAGAAGDRVHLLRSRRRHDRAGNARDAVDFATIAAALHDETTACRHRFPDPVVIARAAEVPTTRLWHRGADDEDALTVRVGSADSTSATRVRRGDRLEPAGRLTAVPLCIDLRAGPVGFAGPPDVLDGLARCLVVQLAVLHPPAAVGLALFGPDPEGERRWAWSRWLPHLGERVAFTADERARLAERLATRTAPRDGRWTVAVLDRVPTPPWASGASDASVDRRVTGLAFADSVTRLPPWCARTVDLWRPVPGTVLDRIDAARAERAARALAPLRDAARGEVAPPDRCHLLDVLGLAEPSTDEILARWAASGGRADTVLGLTAAGSWTLDLERDGPHVLVAGTTGSGKSELLRTMVLGLALLHPPDELTFVLVDFKGGAAFADCSALPHAVGSVTDLDPHLTRRALHSLEAELRRRERALAAAGVSDLRGYRAAGGSGLARLVIVVDEFAALADTLPDFLHGLVSVARRGRSLGVHLVLATQRPGVAVTPEIRANTACRIALRVVEGSESTDVIGVPTAAELPARRPGRALGSTSGEPVEFQTATVDGAVRDRPGDVSVTRLGPWPRRTVTAPAGEPARGSSNLVDVARRAAVERGVPAGTGPWRAPLPERLAVDQLQATAPDRVPVALVDRPDDQRQDVLELDLREAGSWLLVGGSRSGRTTALLGLALTAAATLSPAELEIYVLDGGGPLAAALRDLPHVATCLGPDELSVAGTLARRLADRPPGRAHVLLLVDDGERVLTADAVGPPAPDGLAHLAAAVTGRRATVVVAGSRTLLSTRVAAGFDHRLLLALADRSDYALAGVPARAVPQHLPPGRAVRVGDGVELQFAVVGGSPDDPASTVRAIATRWGPAGRARDAVRLRPLPRAVRLSSLASPRPRLLRLGLGGESAQAVLLDPFAGSRRWWVAGPARSGRTTALLTLLDEATRVGLPTVVVAAPQSAPARCAEASGARVLDPSETRTIDPPTAPTLVLVDDVDLLADSPLDDVLARWARGSDTLAFVVAGRSDVLPAAHRGLTAEIRRARSGILLRPGPLDGELFDVRLPPTGELPPGRGLLVATSGWSVGGEPTDGAAPVPVQVAQP